MAVKLKNGKDRANGVLVTGNQNDTVGLVVWAGSEGHNLNQAISGGQYLPVIPAGDTLGGEWRDPEEVAVGRYVCISKDGHLWSASPEELAAEGWLES